MGQIDSNWDKSVTFNITIQYIFGSLVMFLAHIGYACTIVPNAIVWAYMTFEKEKEILFKSIKRNIARMLDDSNFFRFEGKCKGKIRDRTRSK